MTTTQWWQRVGWQRDWIWRGWQVRYSFFPSLVPQGEKRSPLLFIHGFGASLEHWRHNLPFWLDGEPGLGNRPVYALDLLGFGASRKVKAPYGVQLWRQQVFDFWQTFIGEPCFLVGNSLGSLVAFHTVAIAPELAQGLVMVNLPDPTPRQKQLPPFLQRAMVTMNRWVVQPWLIELILRFARRPQVLLQGLNQAYCDHRNLDQDLQLFIRNAAHDEDSAIALTYICRSLEQYQQLPTVAELLPQISVPMLLVWGESDRLVPLKTARDWLNRNPQLQLEVLPHQGHCPHDEKPEIFNHLLLKWIQTRELLASHSSPISPFQNGDRRR